MWKKWNIFCITCTQRVYNFFLQKCWSKYVRKVFLGIVSYLTGRVSYLQLISFFLHSDCYKIWSWRLQNIWVVRKSRYEIRYFLEINALYPSTGSFLTWRENLVRAHGNLDRAVTVATLSLNWKSQGKRHEIVIDFQKISFIRFLDCKNLVRHHLDCDNYLSRPYFGLRQSCSPTGKVSGREWDLRNPNFRGR